MNRKNSIGSENEFKIRGLVGSVKDDRGLLMIGHSVSLRTYRPKMPSSGENYSGLSRFRHRLYRPTGVFVHYLHPLRSAKPLYFLPRFSPSRDFVLK